MTRGWRPLVEGSLVGTVAAGAAATLVLTILAGPAAWIALLFSPVILCFAIIYAAPHALLLGFPAASLLGRRWPVTWWNATLSGVAIGAAPTALMLYVSNPGGVRGGDTGTWSIIGFCAAMGAVGGLAFYLKLAGMLDRWWR